MVQPPTPSESLYHCAGCANGATICPCGAQHAHGAATGGGRAARGLEERRGLAAREGNQVCGEGTRGVLAGPPWLTAARACRACDDRAVPRVDLALGTLRLACGPLRIAMTSSSQATGARSGRQCVGA